MDASTALSLAAFALAAGAGAHWVRAARRVAIPADRRGHAAAMALALGLGIAALARGPGWLGGALALPAVLAAGFFLFTLAVSRQQGGPCAFRLGEPAPDFSALTDAGEPFRFADTRGAPVLLEFFRGHW